jgi:hypothetical protein
MHELCSQADIARFRTLKLPFVEQDDVIADNQTLKSSMGLVIGK